jgi:ubiquitin-protein ligase
MILFRNKREIGHTLLSVASLRIKKDMEELATRRYLAGYALISVSISYLQGIFICIPVSFKVKSDSGSVYSDAIFECLIKVSPGYPFKPPEMYVMNRVYHPNVDIDTGLVCMEILQEPHWKPVMTLNSIIFAFEILIYEPNLNYVPANPINLEMKDLYLISIDQFFWRVKTTLQGGLFYQKYFFNPNYGEALNKKRIRNQSSGPSKRIKVRHESQGMNVEIELKNN